MRRTVLAFAVLVLAVPCLPALPTPTPPAAAPAGDDEKLLKAAKIPTDGPGLLDYFRKRTLSDADLERLHGLVGKLGDESFKVRQKAYDDLIAAGPAALPLLRRALTDPDEEIKERARDGIAALQGGPGPAQSAAAARLLRQRAPAGAAAVLLAYVPCADNEMVDDEVAYALAVTAVRDGKVDAAVAAAIKDKLPARRAVAALVLGRSGTTEQRAAAAALLTDRDPHVRFRAAQGLFAARDRAAGPVLIALLTDGPPEVAARAADLLASAAGNRAPRVPLGEDTPSRRRCRAAWESWWNAHGKTGLARADVDLPPFNPTLKMRDAARQFVTSYGQGDKDALKKVTDAPFLVSLPNLGVAPRTVKTRDELEKFFDQELPGGAPGQPMVFTILATGDVNDFLRTVPPEERPFWAGLRRKDVRAVFVQWQIPGRGGPEAFAFLVRVTSDPPRIVGVGQMQSVERLIFEH